MGYPLITMAKQRRDDFPQRIITKLRDRVSHRARILAVVFLPLALFKATLKKLSILARPLISARRHQMGRDMTLLCQKNRGKELTTQFGYVQGARIKLTKMQPLFQLSY